MATMAAKRSVTPVEASEERMLAAWMTLSKAEQTPDTSVAQLDRLYDAYLRALHEYVAAMRAQMMARKSWAAGGDH